MESTSLDELAARSPRLRSSAGAPRRWERSMASFARLRRAGQLRASRARLSQMQSAFEAALAKPLAEGSQDLSRVLPSVGAVVLLADLALDSSAACQLLAMLQAVRPGALLLAPDPDPLSARRSPWIAARIGRRGLEFTRTRTPLLWVESARRGGHALLLLAAAAGRRDRRLHPDAAPLVRAAKSPLVPVHLGASRVLFGALDGKRRAEPRGWRLRVGRAVAAPRLSAFDQDGRLLEYLRLRIFALRFASRTKGPGAVRRLGRLLARPKDVLVPVLPGDTPELLEAELRALDPRACLVEQGNLAVYLVRAAMAPRLLREIGRLRELTFRAVGEGSGRELDVDEYDLTYEHLLVWDRDARLLVGAYRMRGTDQVGSEEGERGLYTRSLFRYDDRLLQSLGPALELGRSFVRAEYQRSYAPLLLLWRGIGTYVAQNPRYRCLFGAVSITAHYQPLSKALMVQYLKSHSLSAELSAKVSAPRPFRPEGRVQRGLRSVSVDLADVEELSQLVSDIELDRKGIPVLLREYLKLGGRILGFNVDPAFSNVLDALVVVDLMATDQRVLRRYFGADGLESFRSAQPTSQESLSARWRA